MRIGNRIDNGNDIDNIPLRETVLDVSYQICMSKSPNKHAKIFVTAQPTTILGHENALATNDTNLLVDVSKDVRNMDNFKNSIIKGFKWASQEGPLCGEPLHKVTFNLHDIRAMGDFSKGVAQILVATKRALYASILSAKPALLEPLYLIEIVTPNCYLGHIQDYLNKITDNINICEEKTTNNLYKIKVHISHRNSCGLNEYIQNSTNNEATTTISMHDWTIIPGDPLDPESEAGKLVRKVRIKKGFSENVPNLSNYLDQL